MKTALPIVLLLWLGLAPRAGAVTNLFITHFETSEGYNPNYELIGQQGWVSDTTSYGGNGLVSDFLGTQAAYIGMDPLNPRANYLAVWQPIHYAPLETGQPIVRFYSTISIVDSSNGYRDDFYWSVYNTDNHHLFTLDFYNQDLHIYYLLDGHTNFVDTGLTFVNGSPYTVTMLMDFFHNAWSATVGGRIAVTNQPIATAQAALTLGDIDAVWAPADPQNPGDNYMIFDNYRVTAEPAPVPGPAELVNAAYTPGGQFSCRLTGSSGFRYAIDSSTDLRQWIPLATNAISGGYFGFVDTSAPFSPTRYYRARWVP
jgi:hypothetical protein